MKVRYKGTFDTMQRQIGTNILSFPEKDECKKGLLEPDEVGVVLSSPLVPFRSDIESLPIAGAAPIDLASLKALETSNGIMEVR